MSTLGTIILAAFPLGVVAYFLYSRRRRLTDIPGPRGIPLLGNALQLDQQKPNETLFDWAKQFGGVFKINLFGEEIVVVNSVEGIREILLTKSEDYAGRPLTFRITYFIEDFDIVFHDIGPRWKLMKQTCMSELKQVGEHLKKLEDITMEVINDLVKDIKALEGHPVDLREQLHAAVAYVTFSLVHGRKMTVEEHEEFVYLDQITCELSNPTGSGAELDVFPWLRFLPNSIFSQMKILKPRVTKFMETQLRTTMADYRNNDVTCAVDGLLRERQRHLADPNQPEVSLGNIDGAARDLLVAGTLTTSSALYYLVALMASHQNIQKAAHDHIVDAIGDRVPTLKDRPSIPYIESMIFEMLRLMSHVPVSIPHKTMRDTTLLGYNIPRNTQVWANLWYLHHDATLWQDPWKFKADRFLDNEGNLVLADHPLRKQLFAFGAGRRVCAGEAMARNRLFLFIVVLLQNFQFLPTDGEIINTDPRNFQLGIVLRPDEFHVQVKERN